MDERKLLSKLPVDLALATPFLLILIINIWHHELWSDELHAWGVTVASPSLIELFRNLHYEGHPGLWHILLWGTSIFTSDPIALKVTHGLIAVALVLLISTVAPFGRIEKVLLLLNYFVVYEFTVLARNYGIAMVLALLYAYVRCGEQERPILVGVILGLMGNTNIYAFMLSGLLALEYLYNGMIRTRSFREIRPLNLVSGGCIFAALMLLALATVYPPADITRHGQSGDGAKMFHFGLQLLRAIVSPFFPIDFSFPTTFALPGNGYEGGLRLKVAVLLLVLVLICLWNVFRPVARFFLLVAITALAAGIFSALVYPGAIRHFGVVFIAFVTLLWIIRERAPETSSANRVSVSIAVLCLLFTGAIGGCLTLAGQWTRPFAINGAAARWLYAHEPPNFALVGFPDMRLEAIAIVMHRPFYALECACEDTYVKFLRRRDDFTDAMIPERLEAAVLAYQPRPVVLIAGDPLPEAARAEILARGMTLTARVHLDGAERDKAVTIFDVIGPNR